MAQPTRLLCVFVATLAVAGPAAPQADPPAQPAPWAAKAGAARQASADVATTALRALRNTSAADLDDITRRFPAVADGCNACDRAFAREAPAIKP